MKIRNGFVSNSSSSSFVLQKGDIGTVDYSFDDGNNDKVTCDVFRELKMETVFDVARVMIHRRGWNDDIELEFKIDELELVINHMKKKKIDLDIGVYFESCNYSTWIKKEGDYFIIDTCNNHTWYDVLPTQYGLSILSKDIKEKYNIDDDDYTGDFKTKTKFISLYTGIIGSEVDNWENRCCGEMMWNTDDGIICPKCGKKKGKLLK